MLDRRHLGAAVIALPAGATSLIGRGSGARAADGPGAARPAGRPAPRPRPPATLVHKVETQDLVVFLTIDDGSVRDEDLIAALKERGIPPTMFPTRSHVEQDPAFFRRLRDETGGSIETHPDLAGRPLAELDPVSDYYAATFGERPTLFRVPYGHSDTATLRAAGEADAKYVTAFMNQARHDGLTPARLTDYLK